MLIPSMVVAFLLALVLAEMVRRHAGWLGMIDAPNARSSHHAPTPRGGALGVAFSFLLLGGGTWIGWLGLPMPPAAGGGLFALAMVAAIGFVDDRGHVPAGVRFSVHLLASGVVVYALDVPTFVLPGVGVPPGSVRAVLLVLTLTWLINLYNFMDGIDGIAGIEAMTVLSGVVVLAADRGSVAAASWAWVLLAGVAGFLILNWAPAKVFMGDAASGFLGLALALLILDVGRRIGIDPIVGMILLGVFVVDATWTLLRRIGRGESLYHAHRSHAYQHATGLWFKRLRDAGMDAESARSQAHRRVSFAVAVVNLFWLLPWAILAARVPEWAWAWLVVAYLPLLGVAIRLRAGVVGD